MSKVFERVLVAAAEADRFFDLSWDEQVRWMVERAYRVGQADLLGTRATPAGQAPVLGKSVRPKGVGRRTAAARQ